MRVLIIEQERTMRQSLSYFMRGFGDCHVCLAESGREGVSMFESHPFDIVLCGDRLPDGSGLEVLKDLVIRKPGLVSILLTVHGDEETRQQAVDAGIQGYLEKPFNLKQLEEVISVGQSPDKHQ
jgi:two-component system, response regulator YesN